MGQFILAFLLPGSLTESSDVSYTYKCFVNYEGSKKQKTLLLKKTNEMFSTKPTMIFFR